MSDASFSSDQTKSSAVEDTGAGDLFYQVLKLNTQAKVSVNMIRGFYQVTKTFVRPLQAADWGELNLTREDM